MTPPEVPDEDDREEEEDDAERPEEEADGLDVAEEVTERPLDREGGVREVLGCGETDGRETLGRDAGALPDKEETRADPEAPPPELLEIAWLLAAEGRLEVP